MNINKGKIRLCFETNLGTYPSIRYLHNQADPNQSGAKVLHLRRHWLAYYGMRIYGNEVDESVSWNGYAEDGDTITFDSPFTLEAGKINTHKIETGSYPQIHQTSSLLTDTGRINCTSFVYANGKEYDDWIPAIRLWS